jgi:hypothetical protein
LQAVSVRSRNDPAYLRKLQEAARKPINLAIMTNLAWPFPINTTNGCKLDGVPLDCRIHKGGTEVRSFAEADGGQKEEVFNVMERLEMSTVAVCARGLVCVHVANSHGQASIKSKELDVWVYRRPQAYELGPSQLICAAAWG